MRVLAIEPGPHYSVHDVHVGWVEAFKNAGCEVVDLNYSDRLGFYYDAGRMCDGEFRRYFEPVTAIRMAAKGIQSACFEFRPDVVFITSCFFIPLDTLDVIRAHGIKVVINHLESPYEDDRQGARAAHADINLINDPTNIAGFPPNTHYMPAAHRPTIHHPGPGRDDYRSDVVFVGTAMPSRVSFFEQVDFDGIDVAFAGNWAPLAPSHPLTKYVAHDLNECCDNTDTAELYRSSTTSANVYRLEADKPELEHGWACGPREIELAACGLWFARQSRPESDELFPMLPTFEHPSELGDLIRWALANPDKRQAAADAARAAVADRTFDNNCRRLLGLLEES